MSRHHFDLVVDSDWAIDPVELDNILFRAADYIKESLDVDASARFEASVECDGGCDLRPGRGGHDADCPSVTGLEPEDEEWD